MGCILFIVRWIDHGMYRIYIYIHTIIQQGPTHPRCTITRYWRLFVRSFQRRRREWKTALQSCTSVTMGTMTEGSKWGHLDVCVCVCVKERKNKKDVVSFFLSFVLSLFIYLFLSLFIYMSFIMYVLFIDLCIYCLILFNVYIYI